MDPKKFFDTVRRTVFGGSLSQDQVAGMDAILKRAIEIGMTDARYLAYVFATVYRETGGKMQPTPENLNYSAEGLMRTWRTRFDAVKARAYARQPEKIANYVYANRMGNGDEASGDGWRYRGRDYCQTTGRDNYERAGEAAGVDLVANPELAGRPDIAVSTLLIGMRDGWFTGRKLSHYITPTSTNYVGARAIINGSDHADEIAANARLFEVALKA